MPVPWVILPPISISPVVTQVGDELTVVSKAVRYDPIHQTYTFSDGVSAKVGPTTLTADYLEVTGEQTKGSGFARGHVHVDDPDGTINAENVRFSWDQELVTGHAETVDLNFAGVILKADSVDIQPGTWQLTGLYGTSCMGNPPLFAVKTPKATLVTGKQGNIRHPQLYVLGHHVLTLPNQKINLDPRTQGLRPPNISYRSGDGFGVNWRSGWLLDPQTDLTASFSAFRSDRPSYSLVYAKSFLAPEETRASIVPRSDLATRLNFAYFENVEQPSPRSEERYLDMPRDSVSVGSYWFQGAGNQKSDHAYTKPLEVAYEKGGSSGMLYGYGQVRLQSIRRELESTHTRLEVDGSIGIRPIELVKGLDVYPRLDALSFAGGSNSGWLRAQIGVTYHPVRFLTIGGSVHDSYSWGNPLYEIDTLESARGGTARIDLNMGPTQATYIWRYDSSMGWYDRQYMVSQVVGCLQPYVMYRKWEEDYRVGVNIRLGNLLDVISRRKYQRGDAKSTVIDEPGRASR